MSVALNPDSVIRRPDDIAHTGTSYLDDPGKTLGQRILSWVFTVDHKRLGVMYLASVLLFFFVGGVFALLVRTQLLQPAANGETSHFLTEKQYNQVFTLHGAIMTFLVIIPSVPAAFGNFTLPIMLGAKDVAFPRLNLFSFHLYWVGAILFLCTLVMGGLDTGWTFYTPYSTNTDGKSAMAAVIPATAGAFVLGFSSIFTGLNFIVTVHMMRPPGMSWFRIPLFIWALYATAIIQVLATPVLGITLLLLIVERSFKIGIFDPVYGGDPVLFQHFFWFYSHPAVYIMILPAMGIISELIATFARKPIFGYRFVAFSSIGLALLGFLVWGHHMFTSESALGAVVFSALTFTVAIPSAIKVFNWLGTLHKGSISLETPMCYALSFILLFAIGGLTGIFLGTLNVDIHLHDTYFVVAHFHYVMMGSALIAMIGGLHYWWPKMFGVTYDDFLGRIACAIIFIGFNLTFLPQFVMGTRGMPRRYFTYMPEHQNLHIMSSIGAYIMAVGFFIVLGYLIESLIAGRKAPANPWGGTTLEWQCQSPPTTHNFEVQPQVGEPYCFEEFEQDTQNGGWRRKPAVRSATA